MSLDLPPDAAPDVDKKRKTRAREKMIMIERYCSIDPNGYFAFPPSDPPAPPPPLQLEIMPPFAEFIEFGGASRHVITNRGTQRIVWKIQCSNNELFKVAPVFQFLSPGESHEFNIVRCEGPTQQDKLVIMYREVREDETIPKRDSTTAS